MPAIPTDQTIFAGFDWKKGKLTDIQREYIKAYADHYLDRQLATDFVDEDEVVNHVLKLYRECNIDSPSEISWVDSPTKFHITECMSETAWGKIRDESHELSQYRVQHFIGPRLLAEVEKIIFERLRPIKEQIWPAIHQGVWAHVWATKRHLVLESLEDDIAWSMIHASMRDSVWKSIRAYYWAHEFAPLLFFQDHTRLINLNGLDLINSAVSGYWFGRRQVVLVRKPTILLHSEGKLSTTANKAVEYKDGWGFFM